MDGRGARHRLGHPGLAPVTTRERRAVDQAITDLHAGLPAEGVLMRILLALRAENRPVDAGQED